MYPHKIEQQENKQHVLDDAFFYSFVVGVRRALNWVLEDLRARHNLRV
jgi:hypothetical protein